MVKSGCGQSGQSGSKDWKIDSNRWNITEFLHDDTDSQKTKADQKNNCGMVWWCDSKIDCISKSGFELMYCESRNMMHFSFFMVQFSPST